MTTSPRVNKLKAAMHGMQQAEAPPQTAEVISMPVATKYPVSPSRVGKRQVSGYFGPDTVKQLHLLGIEQDATVQSLLEEALNDLFRKHGKSAIA